MPTGNLPSAGKALWEKVYQDSKGSDCDEECAARKAWAAVKAAGWKKDKEGQWHKKAALSSFSLVIKRASQDPETGEMRWKADTSDIDDDLAGDNMTKELFVDFVWRISQNALAPEEFRSNFWQGGMPYLSISHYDDMDGKAVPGMPTSVYMDGKYLKAKGIFHDTPLGKACWKSVKASLTAEKSSINIPPVQISIGFLDWEHIHKTNGFRFVRESVDDICPECLLSIIKGKAPGNRSFVKGQLVHLALTRVPMNERTKMISDEGDEEMTTRVEDAESLVGEELAEVLEKESKATAVSKSLVVKSDDDDADLTLQLKSLLDEVKSLRNDIETIKAESCGSDKKKEMEDEEEMDAEDEKKKEMKSEASIPDFETMKSAFTDSLAPYFSALGEKLDIVATALADSRKSLDERSVPDRRSIQQVPPMQQQAQSNSSPNKIRDIVRKSVGLG